MIECGPNERKKRSEGTAREIKAARGRLSGWSREISVFPLTKLIIDVPGFLQKGIMSPDFSCPRISPQKWNRDLDEKIRELIKVRLENDSHV
jgi:hypothetical protein